MPLAFSGLGQGFWRYIAAFVLGLCLTAVLVVFFVPVQTGPYTAVSGPATIVNAAQNVELFPCYVSVCAPWVEVAPPPAPEPLNDSAAGNLPLPWRTIPLFSPLLR